MADTDIKQTFEKYFDKYKKTEGDRSSWSAAWSSRSAKGTFEINMTKCPAGTIFKPFVDGKKLPEITGWDTFLKEIPELEKEHPGKFESGKFFEEMEEVL